jgi:hypothetical protein
VSSSSRKAVEKDAELEAQGGQPAGAADPTNRFGRASERVGKLPWTVIGGVYPSPDPGGGGGGAK